MEAAEQAAAEVFAGVQQAFEGDGAGGGAVVEEDGDGAAFVELDEVGMGGVDGGVGGFGPVVIRRAREPSAPLIGSSSADAADAGALVRARGW